MKINYQALRDLLEVIELNKTQFGAQAKGITTIIKLDTVHQNIPRFVPDVPTGDYYIPPYQEGIEYYEEPREGDSILILDNGNGDLQ